MKPLKKTTGFLIELINLFDISNLEMIPKSYPEILGRKKQKVSSFEFWEFKAEVYKTFLEAEFLTNKL